MEGVMVLWYFIKIETTILLFYVYEPQNYTVIPYQNNLWDRPVRGRCAHDVTK